MIRIIIQISAVLSLFVSTVAIADQSVTVASTFNSKDAPILLRVFKEEHQIELWRQNNDETYELIKIYTICKFSGHLGPKLRRGDRQSPEGFYHITPPQMRHDHRMDIGYPNEFDIQNGRTGDNIQIHGHCGSIGCFAITNSPAIELYNTVKKSFRAGQKMVQVQSYPFRMTDENLDKNKNDINYDFWLTLKRGYDKFNLTKRELNVFVENREYKIK